ncbi:MAG: type III pantothenate kinase, partial [Candidatus Riflebacteria bacterium]|nr:type III pantothenate kinase [Candidatus Riflebacteria bacterium]
MILAIDIGNTSAKYAVMDNKSEILFFERLKGSWKSAFEKVIEKYNDIKEIYISNVAGEQSELEAVIKDYKFEAKWLTWDSPIGKKWLNNIPEGYGADRLAADIG